MRDSTHESLPRPNSAAPLSTRAPAGPASAERAAAPRPAHERPHARSGSARRRVDKSPQARLVSEQDRVGEGVFMRAGRGLAIVVWTVLALAWSLAPAAAGGEKALRGVALVVGNGDYGHLPKLANPPGDARAIEELLSKLGFDTNLSSDRNAKRLARDLDDFVEDAEGADVAVLYYAGHGIEAGGENWLVPVDADISSLDAAADRLVPISGFVARLRKQAAIVIVLLDACRDSPFPPDAVLRPSRNAEPVPVAAGGLAVAATRGATALPARAAAPDDGLGAVIGFAAEPGKVALDGKADGHSPYAAAILKHLGALGGAEFGTVMRMVAEEVYLDTGGRQHPWVNESLRRLLYFGEALPAPAGEEGAILAERRQLLVRISGLPDAQRGQVETLARSGNVPMSVVFAMMRALDISPSDDPDKVETRLRAQIAQFTSARAARDGLANPDPEIQRLTLLADDAETQGALNAADGFREQAKRRVATLRPTRRQQAEELRARIREDAEVFARSAETKKLLFRHVEAAADYGEAYDTVAEWDPARAAGYRRAQIDAYLIDAELRGADDSLSAAEKLARDAIGRDAAADPRLRHELGLALLIRGTKGFDAAALREAGEQLRLAAGNDGELPAAERARIAIDAGRAVGQLGTTTGDAASFAAAEKLFREAGELARAADDKAAETEAMFRTFQAQYLQWIAAPDPQLFAAMRAQTAALGALYGDADVDDFAGRYMVKSASIALDMALRQNTQAALATAGEMVGVTLGMFDRDRYPLIYAEIMGVQGRLGLEWAERFGNLTHLDAALDAGRQAVEIYSKAGYAGAAADAMLQQALTLAKMGTYEPDTAHLMQALAMLDRTERTTPLALTDQQKRAFAYQRARIGAAISLREGDAPALERAVDAMRAVLDASPAAADPRFHAQVQADLGKASYWLGNATGDLDLLRSGTEALGGALDQYRAWGAAAANPVPYGELLQQYSGAASSLAGVTGRAADIDRAIGAGVELHDVAHALGSREIGAVAANDAAYFMTRRLRDGGFDPDLYARAEKLVDEAAAMSAALPAYAGPFANTACELKTEKARHDADAALARAALEGCRTGLALLEKSGQPQPVETARAAVSRAEALVEQLGGR